MASDEQLQADLEQELDWERKLDERHITVSVTDGAVTLMGDVPTLLQKRSAVRAAERVQGVTSVADELEVRLADADVRDDAEIAQSVTQMLLWHASVPRDRITVEVVDGLVTLRGLVEWAFQRDDAERLTCGCVGVRDLRNLVELRPLIGAAAAVERSIALVFRRQALLDASDVHVVVSDSTAVLCGRVRSLQEARIAQNAASAAPGITSIESHLTVEP